MTIQIIREAVCLADDQLEPLELTLEFGANVIKECNRLGIVVDLNHASADRQSERPP